jgi:nucleoside-triphosphatase
MKKRVLLLTGNPGVGKTTVLSRIIDSLRAKGYTVGGMISRETCQGNIRIGFSIVDLSDSRQGWLAHTDQKTGPQIGRYRVNLDDLNTIGVKAILTAIETSDVVTIDEIGPMELFSKEFNDAVAEATASKKLLVAIIHRKAKSKLIDDLKSREDTELYTVTYENRENLHRIVVQKAFEFLE